MNEICDFGGCNKPVCDDDKDIQMGLKFCQEHSDEAGQLIVSEDIPALLGFWIKSQGGADQVAKSI